jgi:hypothetical protein
VFLFSHHDNDVRQSCQLDLPGGCRNGDIDSTSRLQHRSLSAILPTRTPANKVQVNGSAIEGERSMKACPPGTRLMNGICVTPYYWLYVHAV